MREGIEQPNQEKSEHSENWKFTRTWEYLKQTPSGRWRWNEKIKKSISGEWENYSKPNHIAGLSSKG